MLFTQAFTLNFSQIFLNLLNFPIFQIFLNLPIS